MGLLILFGVLAGIAAVFAMSYRLISPRRSGPVTPMVRIGIASNNSEATIWADRLRAAGIRCRVQDISAIGSATDAYYANAYNAELWVREKDADKARRVLGL